jgi:hypothetical protein
VSLPIKREITLALYYGHLPTHHNYNNMAARHSLDKRDKDPGALDEVEEVLKTAPQARDYSGAHEKTDPREIALVRKLDWWIMPILWLMYWLNYLVSLQLLTLQLSMLTISGPQRHRPRSSQHDRKGPQPHRFAISDLRLDSLCRLCHRGYSSEHGSYSRSTKHLDGVVYDGLGHHQWLDGVKP